MARLSSGRLAAPRSSSRLTRLAKAATGAAAARSPTVSTLRVAATWRHRCQSLVDGRAVPETCTRSPASPLSSRPASAPWARASSRAPPWRTVTLTPLVPSGRGSSRRVTQPSIRPWGGSASPSRALAPKNPAKAARTAKASSGLGLQAHTAASTTATASGTPTSSHDPSAAPAAAAYGIAARSRSQHRPAAIPVASVRPERRPEVTSPSPRPDRPAAGTGPPSSPGFPAALTGPPSPPERSPEITGRSPSRPGGSARA